MPDERQDSIRQGINAPAESPEGMAAAEQRQRSAGQGPEIGGAMGGTSDSDRAGDEAQANAARHAGETGRTLPGLQDRGGSGGPTGDGEAGGHQTDRVLEETREASQRAQGGGSSDETDIDRAAGNG
jgi:hypothetical protein